MTLSTFNVQQRLYQLLVDANICDGNVFDTPPASPSFDDGKGSRNYPYCVIDDVLEEPDDIGNQPRLLMYQTLQVYTRYRGKKQARENADLIRDLLHTKSFVLFDGNHIRFVLENTQVFPDTDGRTYRAAMRFRITLKGVC